MLKFGDIWSEEKLEGHLTQFYLIRYSLLKILRPVSILAVTTV